MKDLATGEWTEGETERYDLQAGEMVDHRGSNVYRPHRSFAFRDGCKSRLAELVTTPTAEIDATTTKDKPTGTEKRKGSQQYPAGTGRSARRLAMNRNSTAPDWDDRAA